jgi:hypothetical protein
VTIEKMISQVKANRKIEQHDLAKASHPKRRRIRSKLVQLELDR